MRRLLFDLEGNGLLPDLTTIHCIAAVDVDTGETFEWGPGELFQALDTLASADKLIAHFGLGYDFPALDKVCHFAVPEEKQLDSYVIASLKYPNIKELDSEFNKTRAARRLPLMGAEFGRHSIAAWGIRLGIPKLYTDIEDWSQWTAQMQERCVGDVRTALRLWKYLNPDKMSQPAIELEHRVRRLTNKITEAGWPFDTRKAAALHERLIGEKDTLSKDLKKQFGTWEVRTPFTPKRDNKTRGYKAGVTIDKVEVVEFNPNSGKHIERCLKALGWVPTEFTDKGNPKLDEEQLEQIGAQYPQGAPLVRYKLLKKRLEQLADGEQAWLKKVRANGYMHGEYNPMGTVTSRASHFNPNIGQVPAVASEFGRECRELFCVPEGWDQVGADMAGLEGRCFAHYLAKYDGGEYGEKLLTGDPHWAVVGAVGFVAASEPRDKHNQLHTIVREAGAKRLFYGMLYGCGDEKAGRIILDACRQAQKAGYPAVYLSFFGEDNAPTPKALKKVGAQAKYNVIRGIEGFEKLKETIRHFADSGYIPGLDNRRIPVRAEFAALNTLLQSAGAILCKQWICDAYDALITSGLKWGWEGDFVFLGWIHDELQVACRHGLGERVGEMLTSAARGSAAPYKFRIALDSEYKIGRNWADTH